MGDANKDGSSGDIIPSGEISLSESFKLIKREQTLRSDLRDKKKKLKSDEKQLASDQAECKDNLYILAHYDEIIPEQEEIIETRSQEAEELRPMLAAAIAAPRGSKRRPWSPPPG